MGDVLDDPQKQYYVVIDKLDEDWIEDQIKIRLIRALIETAKEFRGIRNTKIILALRRDLLERVYKLTRDSGFQEEKYESMYLNITWTKKQLIQILNARINYRFKHRYTKQEVTYKDLMIGTMGKVSTIDYILDRTCMRPRDIILFYNECLKVAFDKATISADTIRQAEGVYSYERLKSLTYEWYAIYPNLKVFSEFIRGQQSSFRLVDSIDDVHCQNFCLDVLSKGIEAGDALSKSAEHVIDVKMPIHEFYRTIIGIFYHVGLVGLKLENYNTVDWAYDGKLSISPEEIDLNAIVYVHPCFWRALGIING